MNTQTQNAVFTAFVAVTDDTGVHHNFAPGDPIPEWALPLVGDHVIGYSSSTESPAVDLWADEDTPGPDPDLLIPPPLSGPGSGRPEWVRFAEEVEVRVDSTMSRRDIIDILVRKGYVRE